MYLTMINENVLISRYGKTLKVNIPNLKISQDLFDSDGLSSENVKVLRFPYVKT